MSKKNSINHYFSVFIVKIALHGTTTSGVVSTYSLPEILTLYLHNYNHKLGFKVPSAYFVPVGKHLAFMQNIFGKNKMQHDNRRL